MLHAFHGQGKNWTERGSAARGGLEPATSRAGIIRRRDAVGCTLSMHEAFRLIVPRHAWSARPRTESPQASRKVARSL